MFNIDKVEKHPFWTFQRLQTLFMNILSQPSTFMIYNIIQQQQEGLPYPDPEARLRQVHTVQVLPCQSNASFSNYDQFQIT